MISLTGWYSMEALLMPDHEEMELILESMIRILEDHNYKKVICCSDCYFWGTRSERETGLNKIRTCRHYDKQKYHDEWCSDAVGRRYLE